MRRRRRSKATLSVQLFPFLAVLICTFGVLIVLLVVVVKRADVNAKQVRQEADETSSRKISQLETQRDLLAFQSEAFADNRDDFRAELATSRQKRSYLRNSIRELKEKRRLLAIEYVQLQNRESVSDSEKKTEQERTMILEEISQLNNQLAEKKLRAEAVKKTTYSIVPYEGNGGTNRRPIFVECRADGIFFRPSGIRLTEADFAGPLEAGNPLDQAFLAVREYWNRLELAGEEGDPYPLIVVRPRGTKMYSLLRHAIKSWDDEFGYELVPENLDVDYGKPDPGLEKEISKAIAIARKRQFAYRMARSGQSAGRQMSEPRGFRASGTMGGFVDAQGQPAGYSASRSGRSTGEQSRIAQGFRQNDAQAFGRNQQPESLTGNPIRRDPRAQSGTGATADTNGQSASTSQAGVAGGTGAVGSTQPAAQTSVAESRGENWALPTRSPGSIGYVRGIQLKCSADELILLQSKAEVSKLAMNGPTSEIVVTLVDEVWKIIEAWGVAGAGSYWKPELQIDVAPGGETRFAELEQLLRGSGVVVRRLVR